MERPECEEAEDAGHDDRVVEPLLLDVRLTDEDDAAIGPLSKRPSIAASASRLMTGDELRLAGRRSGMPPARLTVRPAMTPTRRKRAGVIDVEVLERVVTRRPAAITNDAVTTVGHHVVRVLRERPGFSTNAEKSAELRAAPSPPIDVADGVLHERVGADDEVSGQPAPDEQGDGGEEVPAPAQPMLAEDEEAEEARLQEEREQPFHRERLADDAAGVSRRSAAQLVPNWNSIGTPVTTPTAKLMPKIRIQNRAASFQPSSGAEAQPLHARR